MPRSHWQNSRLWLLRWRYDARLRIAWTLLFLAVLGISSVMVADWVTPPVISRRSERLLHADEPAPAGRTRSAGGSPLRSYEALPDLAAQLAATPVTEAPPSRVESSPATDPGETRPVATVSTASIQAGPDAMMEMGSAASRAAPPDAGSAAHNMNSVTVAWAPCPGPGFWGDDASGSTTSPRLLRLSLLPIEGRIGQAHVSDPLDTGHVHQLCALSEALLGLLRRRLGTLAGSTPEAMGRLLPSPVTGGRFFPVLLGGTPRDGVLWHGLIQASGESDGDAAPGRAIGRGLFSPRLHSASEQGQYLEQLAMALGNLARAGDSAAAGGDSGIWSSVAHLAVQLRHLISPAGVTPMVAQMAPVGRAPTGRRALPWCGFTQITILRPSNLEPAGTPVSESRWLSSHQHLDRVTFVSNIRSPEDSADILRLLAMWPGPVAVGVPFTVQDIQRRMDLVRRKRVIYRMQAEDALVEAGGLPSDDAPEWILELWVEAQERAAGGPRAPVDNAPHRDAVLYQRSVAELSRDFYQALLEAVPAADMGRLSVVGVFPVVTPDADCKGCRFPPPAVHVREAVRQEAATGLILSADVDAWLLEDMTPPDPEPTAGAPPAPGNPEAEATSDQAWRTASPVPVLAGFEARRSLTFEEHRRRARAGLLTPVGFRPWRLDAERHFGLDVTDNGPEDGQGLDMAVSLELIRWADDGPTAFQVDGCSERALFPWVIGPREVPLTPRRVATIELEQLVYREEFSLLFPFPSGQDTLDSTAGPAAGDRSPIRSSAGGRRLARSADGSAICHHISQLDSLDGVRPGDLDSVRLTAIDQAHYVDRIRRWAGSEAGGRLLSKARPLLVSRRALLGQARLEEGLATGVQPGQRRRTGDPFEWACPDTAADHTSIEGAQSATGPEAGELSHCPAHYQANRRLANARRLAREHWYRIVSENTCPGPELL
ncbi:hypothetical protein H696_00573 [Fonticula alba]|uniref:Uncharacterized protein n=1 Tax=Fonticula alba TaxID=691883 RepID=A0A058ZGG9_FONAL|nr:hypothetical protein H696_00573 [Fonticula alba]KCV73023.1 hypothetical protein H696_00573 [Fonticula alba]|eukprot:XP_009492724.1 hypothetical protein H696_00573 [Fonticula alba]